MRMTVLAYDGLGRTLTVEVSASTEDVTGRESPMIFMGRTHVTNTDVRDDTRAQLLWRVARELTAMATEILDREV